MTINNYTAFNGGYLLKPLDLFKRLCNYLLSLCLPAFLVPFLHGGRLHKLAPLPHVNNGNDIDREARARNATSTARRIDCWPSLTTPAIGTQECLFDFT